MTQIRYYTQPREGVRLFGGSQNTYYADPRSRQVRASVHIAGNGAFASLEVVRTINYRNEPVNTPLHKERVACSPIVPVDPNEIGYLIQWCDDMAAWAAEELVNTYGSQQFATAPAVVERSPSVCPTCDHLNTLHVKQEAYGNRTTCTRPECDYEDWYSIGD